jgi:hypothetical protein
MSSKLKITTVLFLGLMTVVLFTVPPPASLLVLAIVAITAAFSVRGYSVRPGVLLIHRPGWTTKILLDGLVSVEADPNATLGSIRVFGMGGHSPSSAGSGPRRSEPIART